MTFVLSFQTSSPYTHSVLHGSDTVHFCCWIALAVVLQYSCNLQHDMHTGTRRCVWWGYSHPGVELGRMSLARHGLYMRVAGKLAALGVKYTLPPYQVLSLQSW